MHDDKLCSADRSERHAQSSIGCAEVSLRGELRTVNTVLRRVASICEKASSSARPDPFELKLQLCLAVQQMIWIEKITLDSKVRWIHFIRYLRHQDSDLGRFFRPNIDIVARKGTEHVYANAGTRYPKISLSHSRSSSCIVVSAATSRCQMTSNTRKLVQR